MIMASACGCDPPPLAGTAIASGGKYNAADNPNANVKGGRS